MKYFTQPIISNYKILCKISRIEIFREMVNSKEILKFLINFKIVGRVLRFMKI